MGNVNFVRPIPDGVMSKLIVVPIIVSLMAIVVTHADLVNPLPTTPFIDAVREHTTCATSTDGCVQTVRQIRSLIAALAAATCTIAATIATSQGRKVYGVLAGISGLKAVFNQMMYITGGDLMLPIIIMIVAVLCAAAMGVGFVFVGDGDKE